MLSSTAGGCKEVWYQEPCWIASKAETTDDKRVATVSQLQNSEESSGHLCTMCSTCFGLSEVFQSDVVFLSIVLDELEATIQSTYVLFF